MPELTENQAALLRWYADFHHNRYPYPRTGYGNNMRNADESTLRKRGYLGLFKGTMWSSDAPGCREVITKDITPAGRAALAEWEGNNA